MSSPEGVQSLNLNATESSVVTCSRDELWKTFGPQTLQEACALHSHQCEVDIQSVCIGVNIYLPWNSHPHSRNPGMRATRLWGISVQHSADQLNFHCNVIFLCKLLIAIKILITGLPSLPGCHCYGSKIHKSNKLTTIQINTESKIYYSCKQEWQKLHSVTGGPPVSCLPLLSCLWGLLFL